jgi:hypothetical protein
MNTTVVTAMLPVDHFQGVVGAPVLEVGVVEPCADTSLPSVAVCTGIIVHLCIRVALQTVRLHSRDACDPPVRHTSDSRELHARKLPNYSVSACSQYRSAAT